MNTLKNLCRTWVLIEKEINNTKETLSEDDTYPITLSFYSTISTIDTLQFNFRGRCDANTYGGIYEIKGDTVSILGGVFSTDCSGSKWYWNYISELKEMNKVFIFSQCKDTDYMQLQLSNQSDSIRLYFINKKWFEETHFELDELYKF